VTSAKTARAGKVAPKPKAARKPKPAVKRKAAKAAPKPSAAKAKGKISSKTAAKPKAKAISKRTKPPAASKATLKPARTRAKKPQASKALNPAAAKPAVRAKAKALKVQTGRDWSETLFLPKTDFPMKAGLPEREPELLKRWARLRLYDRLREEAMGRPKFILHDGPPYANGSIHIGTGLNKILKDVIVRSQQMIGKDGNYMPGWDCHGLPIEHQVDKELGLDQPGGDVRRAMDPVEKIRRCRAYAQQFVDIQRDEGRIRAVGHVVDEPR
jgi:isoleucyl-tRNA synthetase